MTSDLIAISQALLTPVIAIATTYIAYQQYRIRRDERSLSLYDRRLAIYNLIIGMVDRVRAVDAPTLDEAMAWLNSITEVEFVFGEEVNLVVTELFGVVYGCAMTMETEERSAEPDGVKEAEAMLNVEYFRTPLQKVFTPYMRPAGSPHRQKKRLTMKAAKALMPKLESKENGEDIPF